MVALILAAGIGSRIQDVMSMKSKSLIPINGQAILRHTLDKISSTTSISEVVIVVNEFTDEIQKTFGEKYRNLNIVYYIQRRIDGLVPAIFDAMEVVNQFDDKDVLLFLADEYMAGNEYAAIINAYIDNGLGAMFGVVHASEQVIRENYSVELYADDTVKRLIEKPKHIVNDLAGTGLVIFNKTYLNQFFACDFCRGKSELVDILEKIALYGGVVKAFEVKSEFANINSKRQLLEAYYKKISFEHTNVVDWLREATLKYSERIAVRCTDRVITYHQLDQLSDNIAQHIMRKLGNKCGGVIGVLMPRGIDYIVCLIGILKSGCTYLPLDVLYPKSRIEYMLNKAKADFVIAGEATDISYPTVAYDMLAAEDCDDNCCNLPVLTGNELAYVMFTSGSTGEPKGAMITHKNIVNNVMSLKERIYSKHADGPMKIGVMASFLFDMSVQQIYPALLFGHELTIFPGGVEKNGKNILEFMDVVDICDATPALLSVVNQYQRQHKAMHVLGLKHLVVGGEALSTKVAGDFLDCNKNTALTNIYGPTECTVEVTTFYMDSKNISELQDVFIGKPILNTRIYILDENKKILKENEIGEIYIGGDSVGKGYINNPEQTNQSFLPDILDSTMYMYKTGDLGSWSKDGNIRFHGRIDSQVKIRGYRVELGEIEHVMEDLSYIKKTRVVTREARSDAYTNMLLVAYYTTDDCSVSIQKIKRDLAEKLPFYMIPHYFVEMKEFPITNSGKIDVESLPDYTTHEASKRQQNIERLLQICDESIIEIVDQYFDLGTLVVSDSVCYQGIDSLSFFIFLSEMEHWFHVRGSENNIHIMMSLEEILRAFVSGSKASPSPHKKKKYIGTLANQRYLINISNAIEEMNIKDCHSNMMIFFVTLNGKVDVERLARAYRTVLKTNDVFSLQCVYSKRESRFYEKKVEDLHIEVIDSELPYADIVNSLKIFKINDFPLVEMKLLTGGDNDVLVLNVHHIIFDFISFHLFMAELEKYYFYPQENAVKTDAYWNYIQKSRKENISECENDSFWRNYLKGATSLQLNTYVAKAQHRYSRAMIMERIDSAGVAGMKVYCKKHDLKEFELLFALFLLTCESYSNQGTFYVQIFNSGRVKDNYSLIGYFSQMVPYINICIGSNIHKKISQVREQIRDISAHINAYDISLITDAAMNGEMGDFPTDILFDYQKYDNTTKTEKKLWSGAVSYEDSNEEAAVKNAIEFRVFEYDGMLDICIGFNKEMYAPECVEELLQSYKTMMKQVFEEL